MTFTEFDEERERKQALKTIEMLVDAVAKEVCERHYSAPTQEHQLSAKLAAEIEKELRGLKTPPFTVGVAVQDFPDKGRGAWERPVGADLYISVVRQDEDDTFSKGMLVQSKWDHTFFPDRKDVREQCARMLRRSNSSYVWVFEEEEMSRSLLNYVGPTLPE
jgi:hypothetical protein